MREITGYKLFEGKNETNGVALIRQYGENKYRLWREEGNISNNDEKMPSLD